MVTDTVWLGSTAATAKLELLTLPETATEVWGEVSADGGRTWARWENFQPREDDSGYAAMFSLSDSSPRHFRVRTSNSREALYWRSDAFLLPENGTEDQGGNRGGSITLEPGDKIFQYTDGVTEAADGDNQLCGMERLERVLRENTGKDPDVTLALEEREIGGLGIFMVKKSMDKMFYRRRGRQNVLTVFKQF